jgi:glycosyltransferase involved in cell wall biosynthesis
VIYHDIQESGCIKPGADDVLLGHSWPTLSVFERSCKLPGWKRIILMQPYCHGDYLVGLDAYVDRFIHYCDLFLAITGAYWFKDIPNSKFKYWFPKMRHLDLAVERHEFPVIKKTFNLPGKRRFVYIGHNNKCKNTAYLSKIAQELPEMEFSWIGINKRLPGVKPLGRMDFNTYEAKNCLAHYDFMLTVGNADGNPTTILEAMAWGLIPVCTPQSGYEGYPGIPNVPLNRVREAAIILRQLQYIPEKDLQALQQTNWKTLDTHFNWERFSRDVIDAIESTESPACLPASTIHRVSLFLASCRHPRLDAWHFPRRIGRRMLNILKKRLLNDEKVSH